MSITAETKKTYCRICTNQCGMTVQVEGGMVTKVRADPDHLLSKGYSCPKGRALGGLHHHPDALTRPQMRKDGKLVEVSWDEALDDIADKLRGIIDEHGPGAVGVFFGSGFGLDAAGYAMSDTFHKALGTAPKFSPLTIDGTAKVLVAMQVGGFPGLNGKTDSEHCNMLLYVGVNPMVSHGHNTGMFNPAIPIRAMAGRGEVWTIDPLFTETAKFSTAHIAPYPGKDHAILAWLVREIIDDGLCNPAQPIRGLPELRKAVDGYTLEKAAAIAGVEQAQLTALLSAIRRHGSVTVETGTGVTMAKSANVTCWLAWCLTILTGKMNREGGTWFHPGFINRFDLGELPLMDNPFTPGPPTMPDVCGLIGDWPCAALPGEIKAGNIRALMNFGGALMRSFPDTNVLRPQLESLALNVSVDIIANDTTSLSTHVLPAKDQLERPDISAWDTLSGSLSMLHTSAVLEAIGERRSAWWIVAEIMRRADIPVPGHVPEDDRVEGADDTMLASLLAHARVDYAGVVAAGAVQLPMDHPAEWVDRHVENIGGWNLAPEALVGFAAELEADENAELGRPRPLTFIPRRQRRKLNAGLSFLGSPADIILNPADAEAHGIADGEIVRVSSDRGEIELVANVSDTMRPGVASIPHGHESANVNLLTNCENVDRLTGMVLYSGVPINIAAAKA